MANNVLNMSVVPASNMVCVDIGNDVISRYGSPQVAMQECPAHATEIIIAAIINATASGAASGVINKLILGLAVTFERSNS